MSNWILKFLNIHRIILNFYYSCPQIKISCQDFFESTELFCQIVATGYIQIETGRTYGGGIAIWQIWKELLKRTFDTAERNRFWRCDLPEKTRASTLQFDEFEISRTNFWNVFHQGAFTYDVRCFLGIFDLPIYPNLDVLLHKSI